jgi:hypothetical protein
VIQTFTDQAFFPAEAKPEHVHTRDIAHALSNTCRFGGHCRRFYSVAEHSYWVSWQVPVEHALAALLHDATEAYLLDMPTPIKAILPDYQKLEAQLWSVIARRYGLPEQMHPSIKEADRRMLLAEARQLFHGRVLWEGLFPGVVPADIPELPCWSPRQAEKMFLDRYTQLLLRVEDAEIW